MKNSVRDKLSLWNVFLIGFVILQLSLTVSGRNFWPFSSHTFFAFNVPETDSFKSLSYFDAHGNQLTANASAFMPVEFFKAHRIADFVMTSPDISSEDKKKFFINVFNRVKDSPWNRFDETYPSIVVPEGFSPTSVEIAVEMKTYDFYKYGVRPRVVSSVPLASLSLE